MLKDFGMLNEFWVDVLSVEVYLRNRIVIGFEIDSYIVLLYEVYIGLVLLVDYIRVWGCKIYFYLDLKFFF